MELICPHCGKPIEITTAVATVDQALAIVVRLEADDVDTKVNTP